MAQHPCCDGDKRLCDIYDMREFALTKTFPREGRPCMSCPLNLDNDEYYGSGRYAYKGPSDLRRRW